MPLIFTAISGMILRTYWTPINKENEAISIKRPAVNHGCKEQCRNNEKCCHWGVRAVRDWEDAQEFATNVEGDEVSMAWQIDGPRKVGDFQGVRWCTEKVCADGGKGLHVSLFADPDKEGLKFDFEFDPPQTKLPLADFPSQTHGSSFYFLAVLTSEGYKIYNKDGVLKSTLNTDEGHDFVETLMEVKDEGDAAMWLKAWVCGLFEKHTHTNKIHLVSEDWGSMTTLKRCFHPHESVVDKTAAKELVNAKVDAAAKEWSDDVQGSRAGNSPGITYASIACAVFASVSLIYVILAVKNSRLQVSAEE